MIQGPQLIIVLVIVLLLFGGSKLPKLARGLGEAQKEFREGLKDGQEPKSDAKTPPVANASSATPAPEPPAPAPPSTDDSTRDT